MHWWWRNDPSGWGDGHMGWMGIWWVIAVALVAVLVWAVLPSTERRAPVGPSDSPEEILKRRYAKGEIDHETFERMRKDLKG